MGRKPGRTSNLALRTFKTPQIRISEVAQTKAQGIVALFLCDNRW